MNDFLSAVDPRVVAAVIAAAVASLGFIVTLLTVRPQNRARAEELRLRVLEIEQRVEILQQEQLSQVLKARLEAYPQLWKVVIASRLNRRLERKPFDLGWATAFIRDLNRVNEECGVLFSQSVYERFHEMRIKMLEIERLLLNGDLVDERHYDELDEILVGSLGRPGLATFMKDDLGSYSDTQLSKRGSNRRPSADPK